MNIYAGNLPVVHLIQCVFHSHFPPIYFIPGAPIGNDLSWLCLPSICHKESWLLLPTLQRPTRSNIKLRNHPWPHCVPAPHSTPGTYRLRPQRGQKIPAYGMRQNWQATCGIQGYTCTFHRPAWEEVCLQNISVLWYLKLHKGNW